MSVPAWVRRPSSPPDASRRAGWCEFLASLFLLPLLIALPTGAAAQVLVSNLDQRNTGAGNLRSHDHAQAFTTGSSANGYTLTGIELLFPQITDGALASRLEVTVRRDSSGNPGAVVGNLTNPTFQTGFSRSYTFTHTGLALAANTTYWMVLDVVGTSTTGNNTIGNTASDAEDAGGEAGWSISDMGAYRNWNTNGSWTTFSLSRKMRIIGTANVVPVETLTGNLFHSSRNGEATLNKDLAQAFTTGGNTGGYTLTSVAVHFRDITGAGSVALSRMRATIRQASGNNPGAVVAALKNPLFLAGTGERYFSFTAPPGGIALEASTTYFLVLDVTSPPTVSDVTRNAVRLTSSNAEDESRTPGFRIADAVRERTYSTTSGGWSNNTSARSLRMAIKGVARAPVDHGRRQVRVTVSDATEGSNVTVTVTLPAAHTADLWFHAQMQPCDWAPPGAPALNVAHVCARAAPGLSSADRSDFGTTVGHRAGTQGYGFLHIPAGQTTGSLAFPVTADGTSEGQEAAPFLVLPYGNSTIGSAAREYLKIRRRDDHRQWAHPDTPPDGYYSGDYPVWVATIGATGQQKLAATPTLTISTDATSVTEGEEITLTITADPVPDLDTSVYVSAYAEMGADSVETFRGIDSAEVLTFPAGQSELEWTMTAWADDDVRLADGLFQAGIALPGDGTEWYEIGEPSGTPSIPLLDNDGPDAPEKAGAGTGTPAVDPALVAEVRAMAAQTQHGQAHVERWRRVLVAFGVEEYPGLTPTTAAEAEANAQKYSSPLWPRIADALKKRETALAQQDPDQPPPQEPEITVAAGAAVTEGGEAVFTLTATPAPAADLPVSVNVAAQGDYGITAGTQPVTLPTTGRATLTLATTDDEADEPDGAVTVTVAAGSGYTVGAPASDTVAIADDDLPPPVVTVSAGASIPEGGTAAFTLTTDRAPAADLAVTLTVAEAADGDFVAAADEGTHTVTILADTTAAAFTVATTDDATVEPDGAVTATVEAGNGYTVGEPASASVTVTDDDAAATAVLSVADATAKEGARLPMMPFIVRLSAPAPGPVQVHVSTRPSTPVSAQPGQDYAPGSYDLTFRVGETEKTVWIWLYDDLHDDGGETFEVVLSHARGATIGDGVAVGTIENADPLPAAFLARFGRTLAQQTLTGLTGRLTAPRTPGLQGTLAGQTFQVEPAEGRAATPTGLLTQVLAGVAQGFGTQPGSVELPGPLADDPRRGALQGSPRLLTPRQALLGSRFTLTSQPDAGGGSFGFWGRAAQGYFDGAERGDGTALTLDGSVTTGFLGADYARGPWLLGVALTHSRATGTYAALGGPAPCPLPDQIACDGAVRAGTGDTETTLTAAIPYAALQVAERLQLWGAGGYGAGDVTLKTMGARYEADTTWAMAAAGLRGTLLPPTAGAAGPDLAVTSDAFWTRTASDRTRDLAASASQVTRLRLGLAGSWRMAVGTPPADARSGASLTPKLELGARQDGGDAETGLGVEIGGGVAWVEPAWGLSLDLAGRTLLAHENDDLRDRGFSAALAFDPTPATPRGPSLSLRQDVGSPATGGLDALFTAAPLATRTGQATPSRWGLEAAYGFPVFGGHFTGSPHLGVGLAPRIRDYRLGWRLTPDAANALALSLDLAATRQERDAAAPVHTVGVEVLAQW